MAINVKVTKRSFKFGNDGNETQLYVASAERGGVIDTRKISEYIAQNTGARPAQVRMIISSLTESIVGWLEEGLGVNIEGLGTFLPAVKSQSSETVGDAGVKKIRVSFRPAKALYTTVNGFSYSIDRDSETTDNSDTSSDDNNDGGGTTLE